MKKLKLLILLACSFLLVVSSENYSRGADGLLIFVWLMFVPLVYLVLSLFDIQQSESSITRVVGTIASIVSASMIALFMYRGVTVKVCREFSMGFYGQIGKVYPCNLRINYIIYFTVVVLILVYLFKSWSNQKAK